MAGKIFNRFGVPLDDSDGDFIQPKLENRFRLITYGLGGLGAGTRQLDLSRQVITAQRPSMTFEEVEIRHGPSRAYVQGAHSYNPTTIELREDVNNNLARILGDQLQRQFDVINQTSYNSHADSKFKMQLTWLHGDHEPLETYSYRGCFLQNVEEGNGTYEGTSFIRLSLTIRYDIVFKSDGTAEGKPDDILNSKFTYPVNEAVLPAG